MQPNSDTFDQHGDEVRRARRLHRVRVPEGWADADPNFDEVFFDLSARALDPVFDGASPMLTIRQSERLSGVMKSALQLADRGGYDAVKMRDLAESGIALGTIYRFFGSRDFLVLRATSAWIEWAAARSLPRGGSRDFRRRATYQFERLTAQWDAHPRIVEAWLRATLSHDPLVQRLQTENRQSLFVTDRWPPMDELHSARAAIMRAQIEVHAFGGMVRWVHGQKSIEELRQDFIDLLELVLDDPPRRL